MIKRSTICFFIVIVFVTFFYSCFFTILHGDAVWCYGFSYNISRGLVIYRDFNVLLTPLYFIICSFFIKCFGPYLFVIHIVGAICVGIIMIILFRLIRYKAFIVYCVILWFYVPSYNIMCLMFLFVIIYLFSINRDNGILMGLIIGFVFLTKQSFGIFLIPGLILAKNKSKLLISFSIPILLFSVYLIYYDCLYEFIDYCFLGIFDFNDNNIAVSIFLVFEVIVIIYLGYCFIRSKFGDREVLFILFFQIISYPIFDLYHFLVAFVPVVYFFVKNIRSKYVNIIVCFTLCVIWISIFFRRPYFNFDEGYLYLINDNYGEFLSMLKREKGVIYQYDNYDYKFYLIGNSYFRKLYFGEDIGQYDLLLDGNMGYKGDERIISDMDSICVDASCVFFVKRIKFDKYEQFSEKIYNYVLDNYRFVDSNDCFLIYDNIKE